MTQTHIKELKTVYVKYVGLAVDVLYNTHGADVFSDLASVLQTHIGIWIIDSILTWYQIMIIMRV